MRRRHHYEQAFEEYLRCRRLPYVAVDEARKALLPVGGPAQSIKSFDFVIYGSGENILAEVKGRRIGGAGRPRLESWVTQEDVDALTRWEAMFGPGFSAAFVFIFWFESQPAAPLFEELLEHRGQWYAVRVVPVREYALAMRPRSPKWRTVHLPAAEFDRLSRPLCREPALAIA